MSSPVKRRVLVTGAASGLCAGISLALARAGYDLLLSYRESSIEETAAAATARGADVRSIRVDFDAKPSVISDTLACAISQTPVDALVHGVGPMSIKLFSKCTLADYDAMVNGNLRSAVLASAAVLPNMRAQGFGRLVFFGMNYSEVTEPVRGLSLHAAAKSGLVAFARTLALEEAAAGITVNVVSPGDIRDKQQSRDQARKTPASNPRKRAGSWEDIADGVLFFLREDADFFNGVVLRVNGGLAEAYERNGKPS